MIYVLNGKDGYKGGDFFLKVVDVLNFDIVIDKGLLYFSNIFLEIGFFFCWYVIVLCL